MKNEYKGMFAEHSDILSVKDVQSILGVGRHTVYQLIRNDEIRGIKIGKAYKVPKTVLIEYLCGISSE